MPISTEIQLHQTWILDAIIKNKKTKNCNDATLSDPSAKHEMKTFHLLIHI